MQTSGQRAGDCSARMTTFLPPQSSADPSHHTILVSSLAHGVMACARYHTLRDVPRGKARYEEPTAPDHTWRLLVHLFGFAATARLHSEPGGS